MSLSPRPLAPSPSLRPSHQALADNLANEALISLLLDMIPCP